MPEPVTAPEPPPGGEAGTGGRARRLLAGALCAAALLAAAGCGSSDSSSSSSTSAGSSTAGSTSTGASSSGDLAVTGNVCPYVNDQSKADFYPIQPSFSAGYLAAGQNLSSDTADWAYVIDAQFPYSNWMAWYLYDTKGVPLFKFSDNKLTAEPGSTNPTVDGNPILASPRAYKMYFMPATTPASVVSEMQGQGKNVALLPKIGSTPGVSIVHRSYWSFKNDGLGDYDRLGYGGPTDTPYPVIKAYLVDKSTGEITDTPVPDCGSQSQLPKKSWYDAASNKPILTFANAPVPQQQELQDLPRWLREAGSFSGSIGEEFPPTPVPDEVQFYRNNASKAPYADVQSAPPSGNPPDACGGYVMANLPNDAVSVVHIPKVPSFPDYRGATASTLNQSENFNVQFYSVVIYGATKQLDAYGTLKNSQLGNRQLLQNADGSATIVLYPQSATQDQVDQIAAVVKANGWNLLRSGIQTKIAPNLLTIREKGQNRNWENAISANNVTQGAPCPQSTNPSLALPDDPQSAVITQSNGMGLTAPAGQNCPVASFLSGDCLKKFQARLKQAGEVWSAKGGWPAQKPA